MKNLGYLVLFFSVCLIGSSSCGGDDDGPAACSIGWGTELQNELTAVSNAATAYATDPTQAACDALKASYQAYINALRPYGDCAALTGQDRADFNAALNDAEASLTNVC